MDYSAAALGAAAASETVTCAVYVPVAQQDSALLTVTVTGTSILPLGSETEERSTVPNMESPVSFETCAAVPITRTLRLLVVVSAVLPSGAFTTEMLVVVSSLSE